MSTRKIIVLASIALALFMIVPATQAHAQCCYNCFNPLLFPLAVAGAVVGTAAAIVTAPFCPYCGPVYVAPPPAPVYYSRPYPPPLRHRMWIRGYYTPYGAWIPGHWIYR